MLREEFNLFWATSIEKLIILLLISEIEGDNFKQEDKTNL